MNKKFVSRIFLTFALLLLAGLFVVPALAQKDALPAGSADGISPAASALADNVVINEFVAKGTEWIELYNPTGAAVDIGGWQLTSGSGLNYTITTGTVLPAGAYVSFPTGGAFLSNDGDVIHLYTSTLEVDAVGYGYSGGAPLPISAYSTARVPNGADTDDDARDWNMDNTPTQAAANDAPGVTLGTSVSLNEFDNYPVSGNDKVEIYNPTTQVVTLTGWFLSDGDAVAPIVTTKSVDPGGWVVLEETIDWIATMDFASSDVGYLFMPDLTRVDQLGWYNEYENDTFQLISDGAGLHDCYNWSSCGGGDWLFDLPATLGSTNVAANNVAIDKSGPAMVAPGSDIAYTISFSVTTAAPATGAFVSDTLPGGVTYASYTFDPALAHVFTQTGQMLEWSLGENLVSGTLYTLWLTGTIDAGASGTLVNSVSITSTLDITPTDNTAAWPVLVEAAGPSTYYGAWQYGPAMDAVSLWGGPAGDGAARISGFYYTPTHRIYFLGVRSEDNNTYGNVFYFDPVAKTYAATTAVMPTPVSNYYVNLLNDGGTHGPGLYVVGGRTGTGAQTDAVQVYYPDDNTVATITTDPFPPATLYSPGGVVAVDNKLYVFGGFDGAVMYDTTYVYDPMATAGTRWTNLNCPLPTPRSYIASAVVGSKIYAIGGDEFIAANLTPLADTVALDTSNLAACWQDAAMADLPTGFENGDAPAVYVDEGYLSGGIYVVGGTWPTPDNWVFRYDLATDSWNTDFPQLVIPSPATGRRNQALVYVPASAGSMIEGLGSGIPGLWTFGGYDGSVGDAMTDSSEYFSVTGDEVVLLPDAVEKANVAGGQVSFDMTVLNRTSMAEIYNVTYTANVTWPVTLAATVGPIPGQGEGQFPLTVDLPAGTPCPATGVFTLTVTAQSSASITDTQAVRARVACGVGGTVYDDNTSAPIPFAFVWMENVLDPNNLYYERWADASGNYAALDVTPGTYRLYASASGYQPSFYPSGWPTGAVTITLAANSLIVDFDLLGSMMSWTPGSYDVSVPSYQVMTYTLTLTNDGSGPLAFSIDELNSSVAAPPPALAKSVSDKPRIDPQLLANLAAAPDEKAEFLVALKEQADLSAAYSMSDWDARGQAVLSALQATANRSQAGLRAALDSGGITYQPLYIINAVIVKGGNLALVNSLAARSDIDYIQANHRIEAPKPIDPLYNTLAGPDAVGWNIDLVKAPQVWAMGNRGEGMVVAEIDTGTQYDHPALYRQYRGWLGGSSYDHNYNWYDPYNQSPLAPHDVNGHGTHVMGTMVGEDASLANQIGMAPGAKWISCKGGDDVSGYLLTNELLVCAEWILAPWDLNSQNPNPAMRPNVVNNSWGGSPNDYWYTGAVAAWRAAGIFPAFANGNGGVNGCSTAHSPGDYWNTFSSGATDNLDAIAGFSSRGPALYTGILKPDISAPGVSIRSSLPNNTYGNLGGTSMASPHTAGAVALLWAADPELIGNVDLTGWILQQSALPLYTTEGCGGDTPTSHPNNTFGYGRLDTYAAVQLAQAGDDTIPWVEVSPRGGTIPAGETWQLDVVFTGPVVLDTYTGTLWLVANDPYNHDVRIPLSLTALPVPPTAAFEMDDDTAGVGQAVNFTNLTTGSLPMTYLWEFGDGVTSTLENPSHAYTLAGTYVVTLTATNVGGSDWVTGTLTVDYPPTADFTSSSPDWPGETTVFTNATVSSGTVAYLWSFGDTTTSTLENPTHAYAAGGTFNVTLQATDEYGADTAAGTVTIYGPPVAGFTSSSPDWLGETTVFTNATTGQGPISYEWDFGDDATSADANPTHVYAEAGVYTVILTATNPAGSDVQVGTVTIYGPPVAGFTSSSPDWLGETTAFANSTTGQGPISYEWSFGDDATSADTDPTHVYAAAGAYTVILTATNGAGYDVVSGTVEIVQPTLDVTIAGGGAVAQDPLPPYQYGDIVTLTATPNTGWYFAGWSGDLGGLLNPQSLTIDGDMVVTATFTAEPPLTYTLDVMVVGSGTVTLDPPGGVYVSSTVVTLTATPDTAWYFAGWSGDLDGLVNPQSLTMDGDKVVTATFTTEPPPTYTLTVVITPTAAGTVELLPTGGVYLAGTVVTLTATPTTGWQFAGWSGDLTGTSNPDSLMMDGDKTVTALFEPVTITYKLFLPLVIKNY